VRVELRFVVTGTKRPASEVVGVVELRHGVAVPDEGAAKYLAGDMGIVIVKPGSHRRRLTFADGAEYLEALQYNLRGTYFWATAPMD
jgi:hypothetical protein